MNNSEDFVFKTGFQTMDELVKAAGTIRLSKVRFYVLCFQEQYFGICYERWNRQMILAKDRIYSKTSGGIIIEQSYHEFTSHYWNYTRRQAPCVDTLAREVMACDESLAVYYFESVNAKSPVKLDDPLWASNYLNTFGAFCYMRFYTREEADELKNYFDDVKPYKKLYDVAHSINPFTQQAIKRNGKVRHFVYKKNYHTGTGRYRLINK